MVAKFGGPKASSARRRDDPSLPDQEVASHSLPPRHASWLLIETVGEPSIRFHFPLTLHHSYFPLTRLSACCRD